MFVAVVVRKDGEPPHSYKTPGSWAAFTADDLADAIDKASGAVAKWGAETYKVLVGKLDREVAPVKNYELKAIEVADANVEWTGLPRFLEEGTEVSIVGEDSFGDKSDYLRQKTTSVSSHAYPWWSDGFTAGIDQGYQLGRYYQLGRCDAEGECLAAAAMLEQEEPEPDDCGAGPCGGNCAACVADYKLP